MKELTFIIPVRIESEDRLKNLEITLSYLNHHFDTNIFIYESDKIQKADFSKKYKNVTYFFNQDNDDFFHRTLFLNRMLNEVKTPIVVNYDADVILPAKTYIECYNLLLNNRHDLIYPYGHGSYQKKVNYNGRDIINKTHDVIGLAQNDYEESMSICGHCQFFKTDIYKKGGMENENFISYGPEDSERMFRFSKMGYRVFWYTDYVYHLEHTRSQNSDNTNPHFQHNSDLYAQIRSFSLGDLLTYYNSMSYLKKYNK